MTARADARTEVTARVVSGSQRDEAESDGGASLGSLMLVSASADASVRSAVGCGLRPCPEYLRLESRYGVELLDLSRLSGRTTRRTLTRSLRHVAAAHRRLRDVDVVLSDGEHLGIPLALTMLARRRVVPHVVIGHHLTTRAKVTAFRRLHPERAITRILVHSQSQRQAACSELGLPADAIRLVPYGVDLDFWRPFPFVNEDLILAPGREHRDLATLARAVSGREQRVVVTGFSTHSARARSSEPDAWPANVTTGPVQILDLRRLYSRAAVVVVPLLDNDFPAGITTVLEAMAMGKPVIVSATRGLEGVVTHGRTGMLVTPGDADELRAALDAVLEDPDLRASLGARARREVERRYDLDRFVSAVAGELERAAVEHPRRR